MFCPSAVSHICGLAPVRLLLRTTFFAALIVLVYVFFIDSSEVKPQQQKISDIAKTTNDNDNNKKSARTAETTSSQSTVSLAVQARWQLEGLFGARRIQRSSFSHNTKTRFCGNAFLIPRGKDVITSRHQLDSDDGKFCRFSRSDEEQVNVCREQHDLEENAKRRLARFHMLSIADRSCPLPPVERISRKNSLVVQLEDSADKVHARCKSGRGAFLHGNKDTAKVQKCIAANIAEELRLLPGHVVLEWGVGCGHTLTILKQLFDVDGFGIGVSSSSSSSVSSSNSLSATRWANKHALGTFCHASRENDAFQFHKWMPSRREVIFDGVISLAALARVSSVKNRCRVLRSAVRVMREGARAYFGGFGGVDDALLLRSPSSNSTATSSAVAVTAEWFKSCKLIVVGATNSSTSNSTKTNTTDDNDDDDSTALVVKSLRTVQEATLYPGTAGVASSTAWKLVLNGGSSYAVVIEK